MTVRLLTPSNEPSIALQQVRELAAALLQQASLLTAVQYVEPMQGGWNNRVFRIQTATGAFLLKQYFRDATDTRDRLGTEWRFARLLWNGGVRDVPQPLAMDDASGAALFEWIEGRPLGFEEVTSARVDEAVRFAVSIQVLRHESTRAIQPASEACFTFNDHVALVQRRIERLAGVDAISDCHLQVQRWTIEELLPRWDALLRRTASGLQTMAVNPTEVLPTAHRCLSPSDFGFHNTLRRTVSLQADRLAFFDFEYAGWDDPAKLVCDFFCQPRLPAPIDAFDPFAKLITQAVRGDGIAGEVIEHETMRMRLLLPIYQVKWCCICLNEFLPTGRARRAHADERHVSTSHLQAQIESAKQLLSSIATMPD